MANSPLRIAIGMPGRPKNSLGPLVLFHCCDKDVADSVLRGVSTDIQNCTTSDTEK
jgi:hypothetical protein